MVFLQEAALQEGNYKYNVIVLYVLRVDIILSLFSSRPHLQASVSPSPLVRGGGGGHPR
jgi:hypothetical protein